MRSFSLSLNVRESSPEERVATRSSDEPANAALASEIELISFPPISASWYPIRGENPLVWGRLEFHTE